MVISSKVIIMWLCLSMLSLLIPTQALAQTTLKWEVLGQLTYPRHHHRAAYIGSSKILVFGGYINSTGILAGAPTNTTEIIDCESGKVDIGPDMVVSHSAFTIERASDGDIIAIGGGTDVVERYDVATEKWSVIGRLLKNRWQHCSSWINDHEIIVIGGFLDKSAEIFDVTTGTSRAIPDFVDFANSLKAITPTGRRPTFWGYRESGPGSSRSSVSHSYDSVTHQWVEDIDFLVALAWPFTLTLEDGRSFVTGGAITEIPFVCARGTYVVAQDGSVRLGPRSLQGRQHHGVIEWTPNNLLVAGGIGDGAAWYNTCEFNDLSASKAYIGPTMNDVHAFTQLVAIPTRNGNAAVIISGLNKTKNTPLVEILYPSCTNATEDFTKTNIVRGSARIEESKVILTDTAQYQAGAVWLRGRVDVTTDFDVSFGFTLEQGDDHNQPDGGPVGADGIALVIQNNSESPLGESGRGIGYDNMFGGIAVEFDAYQNGAFADPSGSHVAVQAQDGFRLRASHIEPYLKGITYQKIPQFVADGTPYYARVSYSGTVVTVYIGKTKQLDEPCLTVPINIAEAIGAGSDGRAWIGFTSATGFSAQRHILDYATVSSCNPLITSVQETIPVRTGLMLQPNPATQSTTVVLPAYATGVLTLHDVTGATCSSVTVVNQDVVHLTTHNLTPGIYAVRFISDVGQLISSMLVIER